MVSESVGKMMMTGEEIERDLHRFEFTYISQQRFQIQQKHKKNTYSNDSIALVETVVSWTLFKSSIETFFEIASVSSLSFYLYLNFLPLPLFCTALDILFECSKNAVKIILFSNDAFHVL